MSFDSTSGEPWLADLKNMERVVEIFELLGGKTEPHVADLVTPYRRWVRTEDVMVREAPFSASQKVPHRIYLFKDLLIIGRHKEPNRTQFLQQPKGSTASEESKQDSGMGSKRRSFRLSFSRRKSTNATIPEKRTSIRAAEDTYKVKLTHYLPLSQCTLKTISSTSDNAYGTQLTHVCRVRVEKEEGKHQVVTRVEKLEFWFPTKDQRDSLEEEMQSAIDEELEAARESDNSANRRTLPSSSNVSDSPGPSGERSWAKNRPKVLRLRAKESADFGRSRGHSGDSEETTSTTQREGISLADLAQRYNVDFAQKLTLENTAKFSVEFGEGQMGFSLSSGDGIGVIIGRLAPQSFADLGGCEIGDRLESVNGVEIDLDMPWQRAVEVIRAAGRPVTLGFVRNVQVNAKMHEREDKKAAVTGSDFKTVPSSPSMSGAIPAPSPGGGRRKWAANRARHQSGHGGLIALDDLEKMYRSTAISRDAATSSFSKGERGDDDNSDTGSVVAADDDDDQAVLVRSQSSFDATMPPPSPLMNPLIDRTGPLNGKAILETFAGSCEIEEERVCVAVLAEILQTEKAYVSDLRSLIKEYVIPLRRATKRKKCRDMDSASLMCEHGSLRSSCSKPSSESGGLLSPDDVRTIFMNVETLVKVNHELLKGIEDGLSHFEENQFSDVAEGLTKLVETFADNFEKITPFFTMYALYCHQYPTATERLHTLRTEEDDVDGFLREREAKSTQNSLRSLLIKPVQRICRYPMLFQELLKRISAVEAVYPDRRKGNIHLTVEVIRSMTTAVEKIANDVNQKVHVQETIGSIMNVFQELGGAAENGDEKVRSTLLAPSRRFVRAEEVLFKAPQDEEKQPRRLYLFNDLIIIAEERELEKGNGPLHGTLKRKSAAPRARGKSIGNIMAGFKPGGESPGGPRSDEPLPWTHQAVHWIELQSGDVRPMAKPDEDGNYGFKIKSIRRTTTQDQSDTSNQNSKVGMLEKRKSTKKITWGAGVKESPAATAAVEIRATRVVTSVHKFEIWMHLRDRLQLLLSDIEDKVLALAVLQQNASKGITKFGATQQRKTRSWIQKKASKEDVSSPGAGQGRKSAAGSIDARDALQTISKKYSSGGLARRGTGSKESDD